MEADPNFVLAYNIGLDGKDRCHRTGHVDYTLLFRPHTPYGRTTG
ncbi:hypothetical protein LCGC14_0334360 [marine sediment metagenome]|uniref:Uncharacterized protein n=1 Tax=marine sediment metagenome TaxID=412755 RepID=A0A0F9TYK1_9ZZZZ